jgi:hypothetical protein
MFVLPVPSGVPGMAIKLARGNQTAATAGATLPVALPAILVPTVPALGHVLTRAQADQKNAPGMAIKLARGNQTAATAGESLPVARLVIHVLTDPA